MATFATALPGERQFVKPETFAIDWVRLRDRRLYAGDGSETSQWYGEGRPLVAVADGTVCGPSTAGPRFGPLRSERQGTQAWSSTPDLANALESALRATSGNATGWDPEPSGSWPLMASGVFVPALALAPDGSLWAGGSFHDLPTASQSGIARFVP